MQTRPAGQSFARVIPLSRPDPLLEAYLRRRDDVRRLLRARLGDVEVEDLLQDLYLKLRAVREPQAVADADAYLFRLAYNLASDRRRSSSRRVRREERWAREGGTLIEGAPVSEAPAADVAVAAQEELRILLAVVERLPARTREVFRLHKLEGLSHAEAARSLGVTKSAVEKHMARALAELARELKR